MIVKVALLAKYDKIPSEDFLHETEFIDPTPGVLRQIKGDKLFEYDRIESDLSVITEGLRGPVHGELHVSPPRYPPLRGERNTCEASVAGDIDSAAGYLLLSVDDAGYGVPPAAADMGWLDPISDEKWIELRARILAVTPNEHDEQVGNALDAWKENHPAGTPEQFIVALRRFTS